MSDNVLIGKMADMLYMHRWEKFGCKCGWTGNPDEDHVDHQAEMVMILLKEEGRIK